MKYQQQKHNARAKIIEFMRKAEQCSYSYGELVEAQQQFEKWAKYYGLTTELKEEGII